ncbi:MAG TPA: hypothetical protein DEB32_06240 [Stenotrophomonas sp.]|nr:hypothetical protein [Stenotrophomonas sp.]
MSPLKAAAAAMGVTPGAISQQLKLLQARTGVELFTRTRQGVALTLAGAQVHPALLPVACPALLAAGPPIRTAVDCLQYPLLQDSDRSDWSLWFSALGLPPDPRITRGPAFDDDVLLIRAAEAGQGIALVRDLYVQADVASGRLAIALDQPWPTRFAYYAVTLPGAEENPAIAAFLGWLQEEVEAPASAR